MRGTFHHSFNLADSPKLGQSMAEQQPYKTHFFICTGKSCSQKSSPEEAKAFFKGKIEELGFKNDVRACTSSCLGRCENGPNVIVYPEGALYSKVEPKDWLEIFTRHLPSTPKKCGPI